MPTWINISPTIFIWWGCNVPSTLLFEVLLFSLCVHIPAMSRVQFDHLSRVLVPEKSPKLTVIVPLTPASPPTVTAVPWNIKILTVTVTLTPSSILQLLLMFLNVCKLTVSVPLTPGALPLLQLLLQYPGIYKY